MVHVMYLEAPVYMEHNSKKQNDPSLYEKSAS